MVRHGPKTMPQAHRLGTQPYQPPAYQRRLVAVPVVRPDASRVVVRSVPPLV